MDPVPELEFNFVERSADGAEFEFTKAIDSNVAQESVPLQNHVDSGKPGQPDAAVVLPPEAKSNFLDAWLQIALDAEREVDANEPEFTEEQLLSGIKRRSSATEAPRAPANPAQESATAAATPATPQPTEKKKKAPGKDHARGFFGSGPTRAATKKAAVHMNGSAEARERAPEAARAEHNAQASLPIVYASKHAMFLPCIKLLPPSLHPSAVEARFLLTASRTPGRLVFTELEPQNPVARYRAASTSKWSGLHKAAVFTAIANLTPQTPFTDITIDEWWLNPESPTAASALAALLRSLRGVTFRQVPRDPQTSVPPLAAAAAKLTALRHLVLDDGDGCAAIAAACGSHVDLGALGAMCAHCRAGPRFFTAAAAMTGLTTLALDMSCRTHPSSDAYAACVRALAGSLREVRLHRSFNDAEPGPILTALAELPHLRKLTLADVMFDEEAPLDGLVPLFQRQRQLEQLQLDDFNIPAEVETDVVLGWARCTGLTSLGLSGWNCSRSFWPCFAGACTTLTALETLRCQVGGLDATDGVCLAQALRHMTRRKYVDLGWNKLEAAAVAVTRAVAPHPGLTRLRLHGCSVGEADVAEVLAELPAMTALDALDLTGNAVGLEGARVLAGALEAMPRLRVVKVTLDDVGGEEGREVLERVATGVQAVLPTHGMPVELKPPPAGELPERKLLSWAMGVWEIMED